jgi:arylsulfatase A-like enzyme
MSDNGGAAYSVGGADNAPLRGGKGEVFEGGIRVVSMMRWPAEIDAGSKLESIMTVMDVFPTVIEAAGISAGEHFPFDGRSLWSSIKTGAAAPRDDYVFFASETPIYGHFNLTVFNDQWKLVQEVDQEQLTTTVTSHLFNINDDPNEYVNLGAEYPDVIEELAKKISEWRSLYPIHGTRSYLAGPPGWRAPLDWSTYPVPLNKLQAEAASSMAPTELIEKILDFQHGERGRLTYNCQQQWYLAGACSQSEKVEN